MTHSGHLAVVVRHERFPLPCRYSQRPISACRRVARDAELGRLRGERAMATPTDFENEARSPGSSLPGEFVSFLAHNKKWWLLPIVLFLALFGLLTVLAGTGAAPFIYTLF
jgi:Family of unknown function (DUF5989)